MWVEVALGSYSEVSSQLLSRRDWGKCRQMIHGSSSQSPGSVSYHVIRTTANFVWFRQYSPIPCSKLSTLVQNSNGLAINCHSFVQTMIKSNTSWNCVRKLGTVFQWKLKSWVLNLDWVAFHLATRVGGERCTGLICTEMHVVQSDSRFNPKCLRSSNELHNLL